MRVETMAAQPFELGVHDSVTSATLALFRSGDPLGTVHVDLYGEDVEGNPAVSLGRLGSIEASEIDPYTGQPWEVPVSDYLFDSPVTGLKPNHRYFIVLSQEGGTNWQKSEGLQTIRRDKAGNNHVEEEEEEQEYLDDIGQMNDE